MWGGSEPGITAIRSAPLGILSVKRFPRTGKKSRIPGKTRTCGSKSSPFDLRLQRDHPKVKSRACKRVSGTIGGGTDATSSRKLENKIRFPRF